MRVATSLQLNASNILCVWEWFQSLRVVFGCDLRKLSVSVLFVTCLVEDRLGLTRAPSSYCVSVHTKSAFQQNIQPEGVLICPERSLSEAYPVHFDINISVKEVLFPNNSRNPLFRVVGKAEPPDRSHPILLHLPERDRASASTWVKNFSTCFKRL
uniref:AlNc14C72G4901 protein n=1 Tax=Albugo laibachii Nc14 TaxID=890382 RepID=F0WE40_9STRA|nr:AlNc14C72G4901 [Albugo laibachii Nc14]|eukprot:CCA19469.1 AlNc14C72G4901 [Albugo laibachii Nc14]